MPRRISAPVVFPNFNDPNASGGGPKAYGTYVYEYAAGSNRLSRILFNGQVQETFIYNNAGRITQRAHVTAGTTIYAYDDRGLLVSVTRPGTTIGYTYDALGVRKSKTVNGVTTRYLTAPLFGLSRVLAELDASQNVQATYVYGGPRQIKEEPAPADRSRDLYLLHDGLVGSVTHALDLTGSLRNQYEYDAFGLRTPLAAAANGSKKHYGYTGEETDEETGLIYLRARYYDPNIGRFISADPFWGRLEEPASQNRYVYVENNPLMYTDPRGLATSLSLCLDVQGFGHGGQVCMVEASDDFGGFAFYGSAATGKVGGWGIGISNTYTEGSDAKTIYDVSGISFDTGATVSVFGPLDVGGGTSVSQDEVGKSFIWGAGFGTRYQSTSFVSYTSEPLVINEGHYDRVAYEKIINGYDDTGNMCVQ